MKVGVLGGIGPEASSYFYSEVLKRLRKSGAIKRNADYPQIIINSINAPELVSLEVPDEMLVPYVDGIKALASLEPDFIVMACNTIHLFRDQLIEHSGYAAISDISAIVSSALKTTPGKICVLGTPATISSGLYDIPGREFSNPAGSELDELAEVVVSYNATGESERNKATLMRIASAHKKAGATVFIAGCTEISELLQGEASFPIVDTLELLIDDTVARVLQNK